MIGQIRKLEDHAMNELKKILPIYFPPSEARPELRDTRNSIGSLAPMTRFTPPAL